MYLVHDIQTNKYIYIYNDSELDSLARYIGLVYLEVSVHIATATAIEINRAK